MKHTMKRMLALLIALMLAVPTFALAEDFDAPVEIAADESDVFIEDVVSAEDSSEDIPEEVEAAEDDLLAPEEDSLDETDTVVGIPSDETQPDAPFEARAEQGGLALEVRADAGVFAGAAELYFDLASDDAFAARAEALAGENAGVRHTLLAVAVLDESGNECLPDFGRGEAVARLTGLDEDGQVLVARRDVTTGEAVAVPSKSEDGVVSFPLPDCAAYDVMVVRPSESKPTEVVSEPETATEAPEEATDAQAEETQTQEDEVQEQPDEEPLEQPADETEEQPADNTEEQPAVETIEQPADETDEQAAEERIEQTEDEVEEQPADETPEQPEDVSLDADVSEAVEQSLAEAGDEDVEPDTAVEPTEVAYEAFDRTATVNGVDVSVWAEPGAFPAGATLSVKAVSRSVERRADAAIDEVRDDDVNVAAAYTFDIKVLDADKKEIQPAEGCAVQVSFALSEVEDANLDTSVYHLTQEGGALTAESLPVVESGATATAETEGFSYYTVEFTYNAMQYVLEGDGSVPVSAIQTKVGLTGEVQDVQVSNPDLFSASNESGAWVVTAHRAFSTDEWMKLTIDGVEYRIDVTDDQQITAWAELQTALAALSDGSGTVTLSGDIIAGPDDTRLWTCGDVVLDLNGHTLNRNLTEAVGDGEVILVSGGTLTIVDSVGGGSITGGYNSYFGGGVKVSSGAAFILESGSITGNRTEQYGGGICADGQGATVTIKGGSVSGNFAQNYGGGICLDNGSTGEMTDGTVSGNNTRRGGGVSVGSNGSFTISGGAINNNGTETTANYGFGGGVYVEGTLNVNGGEINGNSAKASGGGAYVQGTLNLNGGTIDQNHSDNDGGGATVFGTLNIFRGSISNNTANSGGGVFVQGGKITMQDGAINGNSASLTGGVYLLQNGKFNMSGGEISGNSADNVGGVRINGAATSDVFNMSGGSITGNNANQENSVGGVLVGSTATFGVSGAVNITGNVAGGTLSGGVITGGTPRNVYLSSSRTIQIDGDLDNAVIGVKTAATPTADDPITLTSGLSLAIISGTAEHFISDDENYVVSLDASGEARLGLPATVTFVNSADAMDTAMPAVKVAIGTSYTLPACRYTAPGMNFDGWQVSGYDMKLHVGDNIYVRGDLTATAVFSTTYADYQDENGMEQRLGDFTVFNGQDTLTDAWYVVWEDATLDQLTLVGSNNKVRLLICDGATLTLKGGLSGGGNTLLVYAQSDGENKGKLVVKDAVTTNLTVNGGEVSVIGDAKEAIAGTVTVNRGDLKVEASGLAYNETAIYGNFKITGGTATITSDGYGIMKGIVGSYVKLEGGTTTINSGNRPCTQVGEITVKGEETRAILSGSFGLRGIEGVTISDRATVEVSNYLISAIYSQASIDITGESKVKLETTSTDDSCYGILIENSDQAVSIIDSIVKAERGIKAQSITLDWREDGVDSSRIFADRYEGTVYLQRNFSYTDRYVLATPENIAGHTIQPYNGDVYAINIGTFSGGTVTADKTKAIQHEIVTLTVKPDDGYAIGTVEINNNVIEPENGVYTFEMDDYDVEVTATFNGIIGDGNVSAPRDLIYDSTKKNVVVMVGDYEQSEDNTYTVVYERDGKKVDAAVDAGTYTATVTGKNGYVGTGTVTFTIQPRPVVVSCISARSKVYDGTTKAEFDCQAPSFDGIVGTDSLTVTATGKFQDANAGAAKQVTLTSLTLGGPSKDNYTASADGNMTLEADIEPAPVTVAAVAKSKVYGATNPTLTAKVTGLAKGEDESVLEYTLMCDWGEDVGTYTIMPTGMQDQGNYTVSYQDAALTVTRAPVTVTAVARSKVYGAADPTLTAKVTGLKNGDSASAISYSLNRKAGENVGTYVITPSGAKTQGNYTVTYKTANLTVTRAAATVTAVAKSKVYGAKDPTLTAKVTGLKNGDAASVISYKLARKAGENVGTYAITPSGSATQGNYTVTYKTANLTVTRAAATVTAVAKSKVYGAKDPTLTAKVTGLKNGDAASVISYKLARKAGENVGTYAITPSGNATQGNYTVTYKTANLTVTRAAATVTAVAKSKVYGAKDPTLTAKVTGLKNGDAASVISYKLTRKAGENAGTYVITPSGSATQGNYTVTYKTAKLTVSAKTVKSPTITVKPKAYAFDGTAKKPAVVVKDGSATIPAKEYKVSYKGNLNPGTATVTITDVSGGNYTVSGTATFTIDPPVIVAKMVASGSTKMKLSWTKVKTAEGYDVFFAKCGSSLKKAATVKGESSLTYTKSGLKKSQTYKAVVKAYKTVSGKKTYFAVSPTVHAYANGYNGTYSNVKSLKAKAGSVSLAVGKTSTVKATATLVKKGRKQINHDSALRYLTSDRNVATVSASGVIKAVAKGSCTVYVISSDGVSAAVKVTVK